MEKIHCICVMRNILDAMSEIELDLTTKYDVTLNEAMILCAIGTQTLNSTEIAKRTGFLRPHTSKTLRIIECKKLIVRQHGTADKRNMYFSLTPKGDEVLQLIKENGVNIPEIFKPLF